MQVEFQKPTSREFQNPTTREVERTSVWSFLCSRMTNTMLGEVVVADVLCRLVNLLCEKGLLDKNDLERLQTPLDRRQIVRLLADDDPAAEPPLAAGVDPRADPCVDPTAAVDYGIRVRRFTLPCTNGVIPSLTYVVATTAECERPVEYAESLHYEVDAKLLMPGVGERCTTAHVNYRCVGDPVILRGRAWIPVVYDDGAGDPTWVRLLGLKVDRVNS